MTNPLALIIEDDWDLANIFSFAVQKAKFETEIIYSGDSALARLEVVTPDLVVLDLHLPRIEGEEVLRYIKTTDRLRETKVIVASADLDRINRLREENDIVLFKPIHVNQLYLIADRLRPSR